MPVFNDNACDRIANAVKSVENTGLSTAVGRALPTWQSAGFIAIITSSYSSGYAWSYVQITDAPALTQQTSWGSSAEMGKAYHIYNCQTLTSGEYVWMLSWNLFQLIDLSPRAGITTSVITAGTTGSLSGYGSGTVGGMGTVRNYYSHAIPSGTVVYCSLNHLGIWEIMTANCN